MGIAVTRTAPCGPSGTAPKRQEVLAHAARLARGAARRAVEVHGASGTRARCLLVRLVPGCDRREDGLLPDETSDPVDVQLEADRPDRFEDQETKLLGAHGFEKALAEVQQLEKALGIDDLARYTAHP